MAAEDAETRRDFLAKLSMWVGLGLAYGLLAVQGALFILPRRLGPRTRLLFVGQDSDFPIDSVRSIPDLEGTPILVKRTADGFEAFDSTCPHLGCRVRWEEEESRFFCPCHRGIFDENGVAVSGPPADAGLSLSRVELKHDERSGVVYLEVKAPKDDRA